MAWLAVFLATLGECEGVHVESSGESSTQLLRTLNRRGLTTDRGCARVSAELTQGADQLILELREGDKRGEFLVHDLEVAALLVESWVRRDLTSPLLDGPGPRVESPEPGAAKVELPKIESTERVEISDPGPDRTLRVSAAFETSLAGDGASALGLVLEGTLSAGPFAPGVRARGFLGLPMRGSLGTATVRRGAEVLAGGSLPIELDPIELIPSLWAGFGAQQSLRSDAGRQACTSSCPPIVNDEFAAGSMGFRAEAGLGVSYGLAAAVRMGLSASASYAPGTDESPIVPAYAASLRADEQASLALAPETPVRFALGLTLEVRP